MNYKAHRLGGVCAGIIAGIYLTETPTVNSIPVFYTLAVASGIGSLLPDFDQPDSYAGQMIYPVSKLINAIFGHRKLLHSPAWTILVIWAMYYGLKFIPPSWLLPIILVFTFASFILFGDHPKLFLPWLAFTAVVMIQIYSFFPKEVFYNLLVMGLSIGIVSHLLLDMMTVSGIPLFFPFSTRGISIAKFKTNRHEFIVCVIILLALIGVIGFKYFNFKALIFTDLINKINHAK